MAGLVRERDPRILAGARLRRELRRHRTGSPSSRADGDHACAHDDRPRRYFDASFFIAALIDDAASS